MKNIFRILLLSTLLLPFCASAQVAHDLTIYSEDGAPFTLLVNGQAINTEPAASVTAKDLQVGFALVQVRFADASLPMIERKNLQIAAPGTAPSGPMAVVYAIKEKKGEMKIRFISRTPKQVQHAPVIIINNH
ncbi:MAG TPA: hypothetical protein PLV70_12260 [Flavobacteriales bacterium]|nr:hypothetical protein [Flavobacteriales bacterium]HRN36408.1 hypothetical protein [Flavobacteriales bacterium]HRO40124.1 hypothetical protein [Flavobacteriales bacterium]HRP82146.1 hypothetical protein [Flavobacteriales bacterium]HRQ85879.1 hypothetical protein [Flavobacteriales bacterium]